MRIVLDHSRGRIAGDCCETVGAVQAASPVNGDTSRTSVSEGEAGEEESLSTIGGGGGDVTNLSPF